MLIHTTTPVWTALLSTVAGWFRRRRRRPPTKLPRLSPEWLRQHEVSAGKRQELG